MAEAYETLIVGAGLSGFAVATELARRGVSRVAIVEAGGIGATNPRDILSGTGISPLLSGTADDADLPRWCPWISEARPHYAAPAGLRRRVGGRSLCWHGVVLRMDSWECGDATPWPPEITRDLFGTGNGGMYDRVEHELREWVGGPLDEARTLSEVHLRDWVSSLGYPGVRPAPLAARNSQGPHTGELPAYTPLRVWTEEFAREHPLPDVLVHREVLAVRLAHGRVSGLQVRHRTSGSTEFIPARRVVLAAGTIENTRLVAQANHPAEDPTYPGLNDHIVQGFAVTVPISVLGSTRHRDGGCLVLRGDGSTRFNLFFKMRGTLSPDQVTLDIWTMGEQERSDRNRISFPDTSSLPWAASVSTGLTARDRQLVEAEQEVLHEVWQHSAKALDLPHQSLHFDEFLRNSQPIGTAYDAAASQPGRPVPFSAALGSIDHEGGTLPLGSVVGVSGEILGCAGLYVTGPAVFPRTGAANPSLTTLALARRLAADLAEH